MDKRELTKLKKEWYKKLKDSGFEDTEYFDKDMKPRDIQKKDTYKHALQIKEKFIGTQSFYTNCRKFLHSDMLPAADKPLWELFSEGVPYRTIQKELNMSFTGVCKAVNRLKPILDEFIQKERLYEEENNLNIF